MVPYTFNSSTKEEEVGVSPLVQGQPGLQSKIPSQKRENVGWGGGGGKENKKDERGELLWKPTRSSSLQPLAQTNRGYANCLIL